MIKEHRACRSKWRLWTTGLRKQAMLGRAVAPTSSGRPASVAFTSAERGWWTQDSLCADVRCWVVHPWRVHRESTYRASRPISLTTPAVYLRFKCISGLPTRSSFVKLLISWHTRVNDSEYCGVRVLMCWMCERKCIHVFVCACAHAFLQCQVDILNLFLLKQYWNLVHQSVMCFVLSG